MENLPSLDTVLSTLQVWMTRIMSVEFPIPDVALLVAFVLAVYAFKLNNRAKVAQARADVEDVYQAELLLANRRAQQARGELRKSQLEIERERQKRRREHGRSDAARRRTVAAKLVEKPVRQVPLKITDTQTKLEQRS